MAHATENVPDDQQLVRYVLGLLDDHEAERLDEASIADDEVATRLQGVETDLVDAYVRDSLDPPTRARFESFYLTSPRRRQRVTFARRFLSVVDRAAGPGPVLPASAEPSPALASTATTSAAASAASGGVGAPSRKLWPLTAAAVVLLTCGVLVLGYLQPGRRPLGDRPVSTASSHPAAEPPIAVLALSPQTRALTPLPRVLLSSARQPLRLELRLESAEFDRYAVVVDDELFGTAMWRSMPLQVSSLEGRPALTVVVPATVLEAHTYAVRVLGLDARGRGEPVASYAFAVDTR